eukprot:8442300-Pyramimonas_sp.AAC.1
MASPSLWLTFCRIIPRARTAGRGRPRASRRYEALARKGGVSGQTLTWGSNAPNAFSSGDKASMMSSQAAEARRPFWWISSRCLSATS